MYADVERLGEVVVWGGGGLLIEELLFIQSSVISLIFSSAKHCQKNSTTLLFQRIRTF